MTSTLRAVLQSARSPTNSFLNDSRRCGPSPVIREGRSPGVVEAKGSTGSTAAGSPQQEWIVGTTTRQRRRTYSHNSRCQSIYGSRRGGESRVTVRSVNARQSTRLSKVRTATRSRCAMKTDFRIGRESTPRDTQNTYEPQHEPHSTTADERVGLSSFPPPRHGPCSGPE